MVETLVKRSFSDSASLSFPAMASVQTVWPKAQLPGCQDFYSTIKGKTSRCELNLFEFHNQKEYNTHLTKL